MSILTISLFRIGVRLLWYPVTHLLGFLPSDLSIKKTQDFFIILGCTNSITENLREILNDSNSSTLETFIKKNFNDKIFLILNTVP